MQTATETTEHGALRHRWRRRPQPYWFSRLLGHPLSTADAPHQTLSNVVALAVFATDALSSVGFATQEILVVLAAAGTAAFGWSLPIGLAIVLLLAIVTISYEQTIHAYTNGGGSYIVARDNLGDLAAQVAGASLLVDYVLNVAVTTSSGVDQVISLVPALHSYKVAAAIGVVIVVMLVHLRGTRESGAIFSLPTLGFIGLMGLTLIVGLARRLTGHLGHVVNPPAMVTSAVTAVTPFLILRAFSSGTSAMTGVEVIANGVPAFREPKSRNAAKTLIAMSVILGSLFFGITWLAHAIGAVPSELETVISQLARTAWGGRNVMASLTVLSTLGILVLAANSSFAGFPRLAAIMAEDGFMPRQFAFRGSRLVYSRGIVVLGLVAIALVVVFRGSVTAMIPLFAIGVFLSFTLSQAGMARRWWKSGHLTEGEEREERGSVLTYTRGWRTKMLINGVGTLATAVVVVVFAVSKFTAGAWIVVLLVPAMVAVFSAIHRHYAGLAEYLSPCDTTVPPVVKHHRVLVVVERVHCGVLAALRYAETLAEDVTAVHVELDDGHRERLQEEWRTWGGGVRLVILDSPYRLLLEPLLQYIDDISTQAPQGQSLTVVVPQVVPSRWWHNLLHPRTAAWLRLALLWGPNAVVCEVPYWVRPPEPEQDGPFAGLLARRGPPGNPAETRL